MLPETNLVWTVLRAISHAVDKLNQSVIEEFRANQGRVGGPLEKWPILLLTMTRAKTGRRWCGRCVILGMKIE